MRNARALIAILALMALISVACQGGAATPTAGGSAAATSAAPATDEPSEPASEEPSEPASEEPSEPAVDGSSTKACEVSDTGGIDDKGFNQNAWEGMQAADEEFGLEEIKFLESTSDADYERNIQTFVDEGCDIIVTVGFLLGDATKAAAEANTEQKFGIVDYAYDPVLPNVVGIVFQMDEPSMLAGYLAAGMSQTGTVATFGGIKIPPVTQFMDGFQAGINYYNEQKGADVQLLGWDAASQEGSFTGDFADTAKGRQQAEGFIQEGADVIFPVAGPVGLGAMAAVQDANTAGEGDRVMYIGVDVDQAISAAEFEDIMLSSVLKRIDNGVKATVRAAIDGSFAGGVIANNLENEGTGLAPYHAFEGEVPAELTQEIETLHEAIISGEVKPADWYTGAPSQ